jgi:hypothetical protein
VRKFSADVQLVQNAVNKVRNHFYRQHFRMWCLVPFAELKDIQIKQIEDDNSPFFISNTYYYVPVWLQNDGEIPAIPKDLKIDLPETYLEGNVAVNVENNREKSPKNNQSNCAVHPSRFRLNPFRDATADIMIQYNNSNVSNAANISREIDLATPMSHRNHLNPFHNLLPPNGQFELVNSRSKGNPFISPVEICNVNDAIYNGQGAGNGFCLSFDHTEEEHRRFCLKKPNYRDSINQTNLCEISMEMDPIYSESNVAIGSTFNGTNQLCSKGHNDCGKVANSTMLEHNSDTLTFTDSLISNIERLSLNFTSREHQHNTNSSVNADILTNETNITYNESNVSSEINRLSSIITDDDIPLPSIEDLKLIKRFIDSIFLYEDYKTEMVTKEKEIKLMLIEATNKTAA